MSWSFVGRQTTGNTVNGATTGTVTLPAGVNGGDVIVIAMPNTTGSTATTCSVTGFTALSNQATRLGSAHDQLWTGYRIAAGTFGSATTDTTFAITFGANSWCEFDLGVWRSTAGAGTVTYTLSTGSSTYTSTLAPAVLSPPPGSGDLTVFGYGGQNAALSGTEQITSAPTSLSNWPATCPTLSGNGGVIGLGWGTGVSSPGSATVTVGTATLATVDSCSFAIGVTETASATAYDQPSIQPGPTWFDTFKPGLRKPRPVLPQVTALNGQPVMLSDQPQVQPGPTWLMAFKPGQVRPHPLLPQPFAPANEQGAFSITLPLPATSIGGADAHDGAFSITLPLPSLSLSGLDTLTLDQPSVQPGSTWFDLFKPAWPKPRPVPPAFAPAQEQGTLSIALPLPSLSFSALDTLTTDQPQAQPGSTWLDLFKPGLRKPRPVPPAYASAGEQGAFSITLPLPSLSLSGLDTLTLDQLSVQPGPVWLAWLKPGLRKPKPPLTQRIFPVSTESGDFVIELPPGFRYQNEFGPLAPVLPLPAIALSAVTAHDGYFAVSLPVPSVSLSAVTNSGPFNVTLPLPATSITGTVAHDGYFAVALPVPSVSLSALAPPTESGTLAVPLPLPATSLGGPLAHQGVLHISFGVPLPHLTRFEMFGCESRVTISTGLPTPVTVLAASVPDPPGQRSYFRGGRWISARLPGPS